jgi:hypothetical protein
MLKMKVDPSTSMKIMEILNIIAEKQALFSMKMHEIDSISRAFGARSGVPTFDMDVHSKLPGNVEAASPQNEKRGLDFWPVRGPVGSATRTDYTVFLNWGEDMRISLPLVPDYR